MMRRRQEPFEPKVARGGEDFGACFEADAPRSFKTRSTVAIPTRARLATSTRVARLDLLLAGIAALAPQLPPEMMENHQNREDGLFRLFV
jgi:hypothetical protein